MIAKRQILRQNVKKLDTFEWKAKLSFVFKDCDLFLMNRLIIFAANNNKLELWNK